jgi:hypothetical protein
VRFTLPTTAAGFEGKWFHPGGCYEAYRLRLYGLIPDTVEPWGPLL